MTAVEALPFPKASKATMETISIRMNAMSIQASRRAMIRVTRTSSQVQAASMTTAQPHESADAANRTGSHADCQISTEITLWRSKPV